ncbi:MAG: hypothetical protein QNJ60_20135 [Xenococcaceae cyanobacterium MO_188.B19]|nr:hypothetical protein [Xenococcaceae cyanobacterium MO_188.B19]
MSIFPYSRDFIFNDSPINNTITVIDILGEQIIENGIYKFDLNQRSIVNISIRVKGTTESESGINVPLEFSDDPDLYLYQDTNVSGVLDSNDSEIRASRESGDDFLTEIN